MSPRGVAFAALLVLITGPIPTAASAATPSFDCDKAKTDVERLICQDDELADLDQQVARAFAGALARAPANAVNQLKASQKAWRKTILNCSKSDGARDCAIDRYRARLDEL